MNDRSERNERFRKRAREIAQDFEGANKDDAYAEKYLRHTGKDEQADKVARMIEARAKIAVMLRELADLETYDA